MYGSIQTAAEQEGDRRRADDASYATSAQAFATTFKATVGGGVIALPYAFERAGMLGGIAALFFVYVATNYTTRQLLGCAKALREADGADGDEEEVGYATIGRRALGTTGERLVYVSLLCCQLGACCSYFVFIGTNMESVLGVHRNYLVLAAFPLIAAMTLLRSTTYLAPTSHFGNAALVAGITSVLWYGFAHSPPTLDHCRPWPDSGAGLYAFFGIAVFTFSAHCEVLSIAHFTKDRDGFLRVLDVVLFVCAVLYAVFGGLAYAFFGDDTNGIIFLNLGASDVVGVVKTCMSLMIMFNYPLTMFPAVATIEDFAGDIGHSGRVAAVALTAAVALSAGDAFGIVTAIAGGFNGLIAFCLPPLFHMKLVSGFKWYGCALIALGLLGSAGSIVDGVRSLSSASSA